MCVEKRGADLEAVRRQLAAGSGQGAAQALQKDELQAWAIAADEASVEALQEALAAAERAKAAIVAAHSGFVWKMALQYKKQVRVKLNFALES